MRTYLPIIAFVVAAAAPPSGLAAENPTAVKLVREVCSKCHGQEGLSPSSLVPHLAGQQAVYLDNQLRQFRNRGRSDPHAQSQMWGIAGPLSNADIKAVADHYAAKPPPPPVPSDRPPLLEKGKAIAQDGVDARDIPACLSCHGKQAKGMGPIPRLAGQHRDYLFRQIKDFRSSVREGDTMHENAKAITDEEAQALAIFFSSL
jgi:cytochrome c553